MNKAELVKSTDGTIEREISILSQIELIRNPYQVFGMSEQLIYLNQQEKLVSSKGMYYLCFPHPPIILAASSFSLWNVSFSYIR